KVTFSEKTIELNGQKVFYLHHQGAGPALVILHGFPGSHLGLLPFAESLDQRHEIIMPDLPACGGTDPLPGNHSMERYADWLSDFLTYAGVSNPVIIGHSFGARVALFFALRHRDIAGRYVFLMPVVKVSGWIARLVSVGYRVVRRLPRNMGAMFFSSKFYETASFFLSAQVFKFVSVKERNEIIHRNNQHLKRLNPQIHWELFNEFYGKDLSDLAKEIWVPALVIAATHDVLAMLPSVRTMAGRLSQGSLTVVRGAGHLLPFEQPSVVAGIIEQWLGKPLV
ncbi:MAG: alpha/beta fold hydrolase, partial [Candidatus Saccharimonadales bacterium]